MSTETNTVLLTIFMFVIWYRQNDVSVYVIIVPVCPPAHYY